MMLQAQPADDIADAFANRIIPSDAHPKRSHNPSSILKCQRRQVYDWIQVPQESTFTPQARDLMDSGTAIEKEMAAKWYLSLGYGVLEGQKVVEDPTLPMRGKIDFTIRKGEYDFPVELKTVGCNKFNRCTKQPEFDHYAQVQCYILLTNSTRIILHYYDRCEGRHFPWYISPDGTLLQTIRQRCATINAAVATAELGMIARERKPDFDEKGVARGDYECRGCPYTKKCLEDGE